MESIKLGFRIDGVHGTVEPRGEKWVKVVRACRYASQVSRLHSRKIEALLGNMSVFALLRRPFFSIFSRLYEAVASGCKRSPKGSRVPFGDRLYPEATAS